MTEKEWDKFFELLEKIVNGHGSWQEKAKTLFDEAENRDCRNALDEFCGWALEDE